VKNFTRLFVISALLILSVQLANAGNIQPTSVSVLSVPTLNSGLQEAPFNGNCPPPLLTCAISDSRRRDDLIVSSRLVKNSQSSSFAILTFQAIYAATKEDPRTGYYPKSQICVSPVSTSQGDTDQP